MNGLKLIRKEDKLENENIKSRKKEIFSINGFLCFMIGFILSAIIFVSICIIVVFEIFNHYDSIYNYENDIPIAYQDEKVEEKKQLINNFMDKYCAFGLRDKKEWEYFEYQSILNMYDDDYAVYYTPEDKKELLDDRKESFKGIGISYIKNAGVNSLTVTNVYENSPAEKAGIQIGDMVEAINGVKVRKMSTKEMADILDGLGDDTPLIMRLLRLGKSVTVVVNKEEIDYDYVDYKLIDDKIPYIKLTEFSGDSKGQIKEAIESLTSQIIETNSLILDLKSNPGGEITEACGIAGCFVGEDKLLAVIEQKNKEDKKYYTLGEKVLPDGVNIYILADGATASASELLICALQDYDLNVTVIGDVTFGKGIAQSYQNFVDGSCIKYTEGLYYSPKRRNIHEVGIEPDILELDSEKQLEIVKDLIGIKN